MFRRVFGRNGNDEGKTIRSGGGPIGRVRHNGGGRHEGSGVRLLPVPVLQVDTLGRPGDTDGYRAGRSYKDALCTRAHCTHFERLSQVRASTVPASRGLCPPNAAIRARQRQPG